MNANTELFYQMHDLLSDLIIARTQKSASVRNGYFLNSHHFQTVEPSHITN